MRRQGDPKASSIQPAGAKLLKSEDWKPVSRISDIKNRHHELQTDIANSDFIMIIYLANILVNCYDENPECAIDLTTIHPEAVKFLMRQLENTADWYSSLAGEIEAAYELFLEQEF
ncbi:MAG: hypothetical protein P8X90_30010 [Desulfobacterales bacterium]|jgi:hypothetical protein